MIERIGRKVALKLRDSIFQNHVLKIHTEDGVLPYMRGDLLGLRFWTQNDFENLDRSIVRGLLKNCRVFVDAGANLGVYSLLASRACPLDARIFSFEPSPIEYKKLEMTIAWNDLKNITMCPVALSDSNGTISFYESTEGRGALNRVDRPGDNYSQYRETKVECATMDDYLSRREAAGVDFIKIDVEGHELPLLRGALRILKGDRPLIMIEMSDKRASENSTPEGIWSFLEGLGYRWMHVDEASGGLAVFPKPERFGSLNLFAVPSEKLKALGL